MQDGLEISRHLGQVLALYEVFDAGGGVGADDVGFVGSRRWRGGGGGGGRGRRELGEDISSCGLEDGGLAWWTGEAVDCADCCCGDGHGRMR